MSVRVRVWNCNTLPEELVRNNELVAVRMLQEDNADPSAVQHSSTRPQQQAAARQNISPKYTEATIKPLNTSKLTFLFNPDYSLVAFQWLMEDIQNTFEFISRLEIPAICPKKKKKSKSCIKKKKTADTVAS